MTADIFDQLQKRFGNDKTDRRFTGVQILHPSFRFAKQIRLTGCFDKTNLMRFYTGPQKFAADSSPMSRMINRNSLHFLIRRQKTGQGSANDYNSPVDAC